MWMQFNFLPSAYCWCRKWITMVYNKTRTHTDVKMKINNKANKYKK